jgi:hypothetical protein
MGFLPYENLSLHTNVLHHLTLLVFHHFSLSECGTHSHFSPPFKFHQQRGDLGSLDFYQTFSPDENSSLRIYVPRRPILPLFDPFSLSLCTVRHPISIQTPFSLYQQVVTWYNGGIFFSFLFFLHQSSSSLIRQTALHIWLHSATRDRFFLSLTDKRRLFDCKFVFRGPRIMNLRLETLVVKIWCMLSYFKNFYYKVHVISYF